jgi:hypothetical protein
MLDALAALAAPSALAGSAEERRVIAELGD